MSIQHIPDPPGLEVNECAFCHAIIGISGHAPDCGEIARQHAGRLAVRSALGPRPDEVAWLKEHWADMQGDMPSYDVARAWVYRAAEALGVIPRPKMQDFPTTKMEQS